jgi:glyoxylase-like metal-dependent hydrolase (beta-lactamase superfamily II)
LSGIDTARDKVSRLNEFVYRLGPLGSPEVLSSYLIIDDKIAVVDSGPSSVSEELLKLIRNCGITPEEIDYLLLTHIHLDHAGGAARFLRNCPGSKVMIPDRGYKHMLDPTILNTSSRQILGERIFNQWGACEPVPLDLAISVPPNQKIELGHVEVEYLPAPGHAPHHNIINVSSGSVIFAADSLGIVEEKSDSIIPTTPPPSFDLAQANNDIAMVESLRPKLACLAHFKEVEFSNALFERIRKTYGTWADRAIELIAEKNLSQYDLEDCAQLFSKLVLEFPEYGNISGDLKEQAIRIDCAGILNYFLKNQKLDTSNNSDLSS